MSRPMATLTAFAAVVLLLLASVSAGAVQPDEVLDDPVLEKRARVISQDLRCLVCQNQSIDDSDADLARDLRVLVRERLQAGDSDQEVVDFVVSRYGDFVLLDPPVKGTTYALWFGPAVIALLAVLAAMLFFRRSRREAASPGGGPAKAAPLSDAERARVRRLLDADGRADAEDAGGRR